jgi:hypothetical protein
MQDAPEHETLDHLLTSLDDMERWKNGELPMELTHEDFAEIERDKMKKIDEQLLEASQAGSMGMVRSLLDLGTHTHKPTHTHTHTHTHTYTYIYIHTCM